MMFLNLLRQCVITYTCSSHIGVKVKLFIKFCIVVFLLQERALIEMHQVHLSKIENFKVLKLVRESMLAHLLTLVPQKTQLMLVKRHILHQLPLQNNPQVFQKVP